MRVVPLLLIALVAAPVLAQEANTTAVPSFTFADLARARERGATELREEFALFGCGIKFETVVVERAWGPPDFRMASRPVCPEGFSLGAFVLGSLPGLVVGAFLINYSNRGNRDLILRMDSRIRELEAYIEGGRGIDKIK